MLLYGTMFIVVNGLHICVVLGQLIITCVLLCASTLNEIMHSDPQNQTTMIEVISDCFTSTDIVDDEMKTILKTLMTGDYNPSCTGNPIKKRTCLACTYYI